jgi:hypothetical protein
MRSKFLCTILRLLCTILLFLCSCVHRLPVQPPESFCDRLQRTEGVSCVDLAYHDYEDVLPAPNPERMYAAWNRARLDMGRLYPAALNIRMGDVAFLRPRLMWSNDHPYPLLADDPRHPRAYTWIFPYLMIAYSYEETIEHEAHHAIGVLLFGSEARTAEAIAADGGGYEPADWLGLGFFPRWFILCHGTPDDPFGSPGNRASCVLPYPGPINPSFQRGTLPRVKLAGIISPLPAARKVNKSRLLVHRLGELTQWARKSGRGI